MKLQLTKITKQKVEVDVEFPIYREQDLSSEYCLSVRYTRIDENLRAVHIYITGTNEVEIEIEKHYNFDDSSMDYLLGRGAYRSSKKEFESALEQAKGIINSI